MFQIIKMTSQISEESISYSFASEIEAAYLSSLEVLIAGETISRIRDLTTVFPANISPFWGFEIPLDKSDQTCDFLCCITNPDIFKQFLEGPFLQSERLHRNDYGRLYEFSTKWADRGHALHRSINNIWLEYDCKDLLGEAPIANFFYGPKPLENKLDFLHICNDVFSSVAEKKVAAATYRFLLECLNGLDNAGYISQVGMMMARKNDHLRLFVQGLQNHDIINYLRSRNYRFSNDPVLITLINRCNHFGARVELDIDILDCIGETIGLECYFGDTASVLKFLDFLREFGLCCEDKKLGLHEHLQNNTSVQESDYQNFFSHVKLVFSPPNGIRAKAYLGFAHNDVARSVIKTKPLNSYS